MERSSSKMADALDRIRRYQESDKSDQAQEEIFGDFDLESFTMDEQLYLLGVLQ